MKIFLSFFQGKNNHPIPAYSFWEYYIKNGITEAGHDWTEHTGLDWALGIVPKTAEEQQKWKRETWEKTIDSLKKQPVDLFLSYLFPVQIDTGAIKEIQSLGIPCVNFFCDNVREFKHAPIEFSAFNLNWVPEFKAVKLYEKAGYPFVNMPMPIWVKPALRVLKPEANTQITFIGSKDVQRQFLFERIVRQGAELPLAIYGNGWDDNSPGPVVLAQGYPLYMRSVYNYQFLRKNGFLPFMRKLTQRKVAMAISPRLKSKIQGIISFENYNKLTAESMITMGVNRYPSFNFPIAHPGSYSRLRDIEAPMLGACYLTEYTDGLKSLYDIGMEIEIYNDVDDFIDKVKELQNNPSKRKRLRINGQKRALNEHNICNSIHKIFKKL